MAVNVNVRRLAQQRTRVTEAHLSPLPSPPAALLKFPGVGEWWKQMLDVRERDQQTLYQALLTKASGDEDDDDQGNGDPTCCDTLSAALANERTDRIEGDNELNLRIDNLSFSYPEFILDATGLYLKNQTDGLWYKLICETVDGVVIVRMDQTNTVF